MSWYAAQIVLFVKFKAEKQARFPVWENIVLVEAESEEAAFTKAEAHGRAGEGDDSGHFLWGGKPARWVFAGVRKLTACVSPDERPGDGTEVTYNELELASEAEIKRLAAGKPVTVTCNDQFPSEPKTKAADLPRREKRKPA